MQNIGAAWMMTELAASPLMVALVQTAMALPAFVLGMPSGVIADLIGTQLDRHFPPGEPHGSDTRLAFKKAGPVAVEGFGRVLAELAEETGRRERARDAA